jgi:hypothetical protein
VIRRDGRRGRDRVITGGFITVTPQGRLNDVVVTPRAAATQDAAESCQDYPGDSRPRNNWKASEFFAPQR